MNSLTKNLSISGTEFFLDGKAFDLRGYSFFNAIFNERFCESEEMMAVYLRKFKEYGINTLRIWCQWDFKTPDIHFVDVVPEKTSLFTMHGEIKPSYAQRLKQMILCADRLDMILEICAFAHERFYIRDENYFPYEIIPVQEKSIRNLTEMLRPYRNIILQIWNECSFETVRYLNIAKSVDPDRICTSSPGFAGVLGDEEQNRLLDVLTPHTCRSEHENFWDKAAEEIGFLLNRYHKPVIDDEPARCGIVEHGGIPGGTQPWQHIQQIKNIRALGGYEKLQL